MVLACLLALACAGAIYLACEAFTNGIEWLGRKLGLGQTATGTVLAAIGTALPESVVTLVATAFGTGPASQSIGIGAALGGPLVLTTLAYGAVGWQTARTRGAAFVVTADDGRQFAKTLRWFLLIFISVAVAGCVGFPGKMGVGFVLLAAYAAYVRHQMGAAADDPGAGLAPLMLRRRVENPALVWVLLQVGTAAAIVYFASETFVGQLEFIADHLGLAPQLTALLFSPIATEMPETMNALIWCRQGKARLALANIGGALMVQTTVPAAFGLLFTPWRLDPPLLAAAVTTTVAAAWLLLAYRRGPVGARQFARQALLYGLFCVGLLAAN